MKRVSLILGSLLLSGGLPLASPAPSSIVEDRAGGEGDRIERRREWFFESRLVGAGSIEEMARLRRIAVEQTRSAIDLQRRRRAATAAGEGNAPSIWVSKGPSPATFGGWSFGSVSGRVSALAADWPAGTLYAGTASGGLWKTTNDGLSWTSIFDNAGTMTIGAVAVDPNDPDVLWVGTGENSTGCNLYFGIGMLRSTDGGQSWEARNGNPTPTLADLASFASVVVDPRDSNHVVTGGRIRGCTNNGASIPGGIFTTTDGGLTWVERLGNQEVHEVVQDPTVLDTWWAATSTGIYKSTSNGVSWTLQTASGLPSGDVDRCEVAVAPSNSNTIYALFERDGFWRSTDGGASWTLRSSGTNACDAQCWYNMVLRVHNTNPAFVYRGTVRIFKSLNGGSNWTALTELWGNQQEVHQDTHALLMHPDDPKRIYFGTDGGVWKSDDGGLDFTNINGNLSITQLYAVGTDASNPENVLCGGAQDNSALARVSSNSWTLQRATGDAMVCAINPHDPDLVFISHNPPLGYPVVYRSTNGLYGPFQWITNGNGIHNWDRINWVTPFALDPTSPNVIYLGTQRIYRSANHGSTWTAQGPDNMAPVHTIKAIDVNRNFPDVVYTGTEDGQVWRTENGGGIWLNITPGLPLRAISDVTSDPTNPDRAFAVQGGFGTARLWEWIDGEGWTARGTGLPNVPANSVLMLDDRDLIVGTDVGSFRSVDGGETFTPFMDGLPQGLVVTDLKLDLPDLVTAATYGRGAWQVHVDPVGAIVRFQSVELPLTEADGDGDTNVEPGETWTIVPRLRNLGAQEALGVTARLATSTPGITVLEPQVGQYGNLLPGETAQPAAPFHFTVDPSFPCGDTLVLDVVDVSSTNPPGTHADAPGAFSVVVTGSISGGGGTSPLPLLGGDGSIARADATARMPGDPVCDVTPWPGSVLASLRVGKSGADVEVHWDESCNAGEVGQLYSVQAGDLGLLRSNGAFSHLPVDGQCGRISPATVTPAEGAEYYLVAPNVAGREGGHGAMSDGTPRPQTSGACGERRAATCE